MAIEVWIYFSFPEFGSSAIARYPQFSPLAEAEERSLPPHSLFFLKSGKKVDENLSTFNPIVTSALHFHVEINPVDEIGYFIGLVARWEPQSPNGEQCSRFGVFWLMMERSETSQPPKERPRWSATREAFRFKAIPGDFDFLDPHGYFR